MTRPLRHLAAPVLLALALAAPAPAQDAGPAAALVVGDSLAVGMRASLDARLSSRYAMTWDVKSGRTTPQGLRALRARLQEVRPQVVVVSLGSNDGPSGVRFADRLRRVLALVPPEACVVWPSIVRPPRKGEEAELNAVLSRTEARDPRVHVPDWRAAVRTGRVRLPDGLHPDARGYRSRAAMVAKAVRTSCPAPAAPAPAPVTEGGGVAAPQ